MAASFPLRIETPRLVLRPYRKEDAGELLRLVSEERGRLGEVLAPPVLAVTTAAAAEALIERLEGDWAVERQLVIPVWHREDGRLAGECYLGGFDRERREAEIGIFVRREREGEGLAGEALAACIRAAGEWGLRALHYRCDADNRRSRALALRSGFSDTGETPPPRARRDGTPAATVHYRLELPASGTG